MEVIKNDNEYAEYKEWLTELNKIPEAYRGADTVYKKIIINKMVKAYQINKQKDTK